MLVITKFSYYFVYTYVISLHSFFSLFFFNDTATTEIYTLSLTTLFRSTMGGRQPCVWARLSMPRRVVARRDAPSDRKSTRLNSSHMSISYAVFCLKKKKTKI